MLLLLEFPMTAEWNFDGLVGPTHNYSGLAFGNTASMKHIHAVSNPREAALQGLQKMHMLMEMGIPQAVLPPQKRPCLPILRQLGFTGSDEIILERAMKEAPRILSACSSAASMWTANAATVSPSSDSLDKRVHITPANLCSHFHRSIEAMQTYRIMNAIFANSDLFVVHASLPETDLFSDEGAANHTRLAFQHSSLGIQLFTYGRSANYQIKPSRFPARQTLESVQALARLHQLDSRRVVFAQQHPKAIDAGVFHNDVISVGNEAFFLVHEMAFVETQQIIDSLKRKADFELKVFEVKEKLLPLKEAVRTYLFNSQLVTLPDGAMALIAPKEAEKSPAVQHVIEEILCADNPVAHVHYVDLRESMQNGGGPACLRLRLVLTKEESDAINQNIVFTQTLYEKLRDWVRKYYRDRLHPKDLADIQLHQESCAALEELSALLALDL